MKKCNILSHLFLRDILFTDHKTDITATVDWEYTSQMDIRDLTTCSGGFSCQTFFRILPDIFIFPPFMPFPCRIIIWNITHIPAMRSCTLLPVPAGFSAWMRNRTWNFRWNPGSLSLYARVSRTGLRSRTVFHARSWIWNFPSPPKKARFLWTFFWKKIPDFPGSGILLPPPGDSAPARIPGISDTAWKTFSPFYSAVPIR